MATEEDGEVYKLANEFKRALESGEREFLDSMARQWADLESRIRFKFEALGSQLAAMKAQGADIPRHLVVELEQTRLALAETIAEVDRLSAQWSKRIQQRQQEMWALGAQDATQLLRLAAIKAGVDISSAAFIGGALPAEAIQRLMDFAMKDTALRDLLTSRFGEHMNEALQVLIDGVAQGINPRDVARTMVEKLGPFADNALTTARTESLRAYRGATTESYRNSGGIVKKHKRIATRDMRTCIGCLFDDGAYYDIDEELPEHPNGRCTSVPVLDGHDPKWNFGKDWFLTLSDEEQKSMLGPGRYDLWKNGGLDLDAFVKKTPNSEWGDSIGPSTLKSLKKKG